MLESLGFDKESIICSSVAPYNIPLGENIYSWLMSNFRDFDLYMIFVLSKDYYASAPCLNEMGAAWAFKNKWDAILVPGFEFDEISGCIDKEKISIKLDNKDEWMVKQHLWELKNKLTQEFGLKEMSPLKWERNRDDFLKKIITISQKKHKTTLYNNQKYEESDAVEEESNKIENQFTMEEEVLLVYSAANDCRISIIVNSARSVPILKVGNYDLTENGSNDVWIKFNEALTALCNYGLLEGPKRNATLYILTEDGKKMAELIKKGKLIDTNKNPLLYLNIIDNNVIDNIEEIEPSKEKKSSGRSKITLDVDAELLLVYAYIDKNRIIEISSDDRAYPRIETAGYNFTRNDTAREYARWGDALEELVKKGMIKSWDSDKQYIPTPKGISNAEIIIEENRIDLRKAPWDQKMQEGI